MPKRLPSQNKGGRSPDGKPAIVSNPKRNAGIALPPEVIDAIESLPQVQSKQWSKSYLVEQLLRNYLNLSPDYDWSDLDVIAAKQIVE